MLHALSMRCLLGIDPGLTGAVAVYWHEMPYVPTTPPWTVYDTPTTVVRVGTGQRQAYLEGSMVDLLESICDLADSPRNLMAGLERVQAMPARNPDGSPRSMGAASAFNMGCGFGLWRGMLSALGISYRLVAPISWKSHFGLRGKGQLGGDSRVVVQQRLPAMSDAVARKKDHGRADALLIALYLHELYESDRALTPTRALP